jgi:hypothetical protein
MKSKIKENSDHEVNSESKPRPPRQSHLALSLQRNSHRYLLLNPAFIIFKYAWEQYLNYRQIQQHMIRNLASDFDQYNPMNQNYILSQSYHFDKMYFFIYPGPTKCCPSQSRQGSSACASCATYGPSSGTTSTKSYLSLI